MLHAKTSISAILDGHTDLGLSYMQARYYDPIIGRFYANDPVGFTAKNPVMSFNRYLYVNNNPYKYTDPDGEFFTIIAGAALNAAFSIVTQAATGDVNWGKVAVDAAYGAIGGIGVNLAKKAYTAAKFGEKAASKVKLIDKNLSKTDAFAATQAGGMTGSLLGTGEVIRTEVIKDMEESSENSGEEGMEDETTDSTIADESDEAK